MSTCTGTHTTKTVRTITIETTTVTSYEAPQADSPSRKRRSEAEVLELITAGELNPGERVFWKRPRKSETHYATVNADGSVTPDGTQKRLSLSAAAEFFSQAAQNGWTAWRRERDGVRLDKLRANLEQG